MLLKHQSAKLLNTHKMMFRRRISRNLGDFKPFCVKKYICIYKNKTVN